MCIGANAFTCVTFKQFDVGIAKLCGCSYYQHFHYLRPQVYRDLKNQTEYTYVIHSPTCTYGGSHPCPPVFQVTELSMGELLLHSPVAWLNPFLSLGKARKDLELTVFGKYTRRLAVMKNSLNPPISRRAGITEFLT